VKLLLVSGSTRGASTNTAALRTALDVAPQGIEGVLYSDLAELPAFNPDDDHDPLPATVAGLRELIAAADAVLFCTPEYAGALPGSFKNLLDWTVGGMEMYRKPVAWINVAGPGRGANAQSELETVLGYIHASAIVPACRHIPIARDAVDPDGIVTDAVVRASIADVLRVIADANAAPGG
jgi:chromate reductase